MYNLFFLVYGKGLVVLSVTMLMIGPISFLEEEGEMCSLLLSLEIPNAVWSVT